MRLPMSSYLPKILITGGNGQLGIALTLHPLAKEFQIRAYSRTDLDITDVLSIQNAFDTFHPDIVINTAAYTAVDKAEHEPALAMLINHTSVLELAIACNKQQIPLIHLSTDYIFDGTKTSPYLEDDKANPINVYGESKWLGEEAIRQHCEKHIILRVSGIVSAYKNNFFKTILSLAKKRKELQIVCDQITCPTFANDIAYALYSIAKELTTFGTYHYCSTPPTSWYQFACAIIEKANKPCDLLVEEIKAIPSIAYHAPAKRPAFSALHCNKIAVDYRLYQPSWNAHLEGMIHDYLSTS